MKNILQLTLLMIITIFVIQLAAVPVAVYAQDKGAACDAIGGCATPAGSSSVEGVIRTVVNLLSYFVGAIAVIMIIVGGFRYLVSGGESNSVAAAKNTIIYAIVGLVIALLAQALVRFVFTRTTRG